MAKALKPTTVADSKPPQSTADDWMPLIAAFLHIQQVVGGEELAEEELRQRLESGDVEVQDRRVTSRRGNRHHTADAGGLFKDGLLFPRLPETSATCTARRIAATTCCAALTGTAQMATISSCAALTCTAYGRSPVQQRSRRQAALPATPPKGVGAEGMARRATRCTS